MKIKKIIINSIILCASLLLSFSALAVQKDVIMVLDTSLSMVGQGRSASNIMDSVKKDIKKFIYNDIKDGDRLTFLTFDSKVTEYPTFKIDDENDRDIALKFLLRVEAKGLWTHSKLMIEKVLKKARELEKTGKNRQLVIVILTDALDDPPPGKRGDRLSVKTLLKDFKSNPKYWVYYVNFSKFKAAVDDKVTRESNVKVINAGQENENPMSKVVSGDISVKSQSGNTSIVIILIVLGAVLLGLGLGAFIKRRAGKKVQGTLEYWNNDLLQTVVKNIDLSSLMLRQVTIGNTSDSELVIRDLIASSVLIITADIINGQLKTKISTGDGEAVSFKNRGEGQFLENGDVFTYGNYSFKYINE